jgi:hypothetical protein
MNIRKINRNLVLLAVLALSLAAAPAFAQQGDPEKAPFIEVVPRFEYGWLTVLDHVYQSGSSGTLFNYVTMGGQDILFPYQRYSVDVVLAGRHRVTLLYQPLTLNTQTVLGRNGFASGGITVDDVTFASGTEMDLKYGFDFWRVSYLYDFAKSPDTILGAGLSLQIRNASIVFASSDGTQQVVNQNVGPVPILKVRAAHWFNPQFGLDFEADGFYASSAFFNGSGRPFEGWVWDAAISARTRFAPKAGAYLTVRSIGGGANGQNAYPADTATTSGLLSPTYNRLATMAVTLGLSIE